MRTQVFLFLAAILLCWGCTSSQNADFSAIESGFKTPPDSITTGVYWYWINNNISRDGVIQDLQSMKKAGINRAFIGSNIISSDLNQGGVKVFSDEWWDVLHAAMKTATELNIELGLFNCPGWSQSGGPWVKPEQAMRYVAASETYVTGPAKLKQILPLPSVRIQSFQDMKVLAIPVAADYSANLLSKATKVVGTPNIIVGLSKTPDRYIPQNDGVLTFTLPAAATARSLTIVPSRGGLYDIELQAKKGSDFQTVKKFTVDRSNLALNVGFLPLAPEVASFAPVEASEFRIVFSNVRGGGIANLSLSSTPMIERFASKSLAKMFPSPLPMWDYYMWPVEAPLDGATTASPQQVLDISKFMAADGTLTWDVPEGNWIIMRTGMTPTGTTNSPASPEGTGLEVDKMSKAHVASHFDAFCGEVLRRIPPEDRKTWKLVVQDSYEMGSQNITDGMLEEFKTRYGYDPTPFLPALYGHVIGSPDQSDRFLWALRRMVADKVSYDFVGGFREVCKKHGLKTWLENYGHWGFPGEFLQYGGQSDEIGGEFWSEGDLGSIECRAASSCAHTYGKYKVSAESFTSGGPGYTRYPAQMKRRGDWSFTEGINSTVMHVYIEQASNDFYPGIDAWFGNEFNRKNTWFSQMDLFTSYLKRCNFMLQQGLDVADAAYFIGEDAPKMTGIRQPELPKGYSFDYINSEVLIRDAFVKNGRLTLPHGTSYALLVLPPEETMTPEMAQKLEQLVADGLTVMGPAPQRSPSLKDYPEADKTVKTLGDKMWGDPQAKQRTYGKGKILTGMTMEEAFALLSVTPDFTADGAPVLYTHRRLGNNHIYFVTNQSNKQIQLNATFRVKGMKPELWDACSGSIRKLPAFEHKGENTVVPLQLAAFESAFIIFRSTGSPVSKEIEANYPAPSETYNFTQPWEVEFQSDAINRGPRERILFPQLTNWAENSDPRIKFFSGTAVYRNYLTLKEVPKDKVILDLGTVMNMAKVRVNGKEAGGVWTAPYRVDITPYLVAGDNNIQVEVVNCWANRIIGDRQLPENERKTHALHCSLNGNSPLLPSGLLGPVKAEVIKIEN